MTDFRFSPWHWLDRRHLGRLGAGALSLSLLAGAGCAKQTGTTGVGGNGGASGVTTTTQSTTTTQPDGGTGGAGTGGMATSSSSTSSTSTSSTSSTSGTGGAGTGGTGGTGGTWQPPPGTADYPAETEPNDLKSQANLLQAGTKGFTASIHPLGDIDVFELKVTTNGSTVSVATSDGTGGCPVGAHTYVRIFDDAGAVLALSTGSAGCVRFDGSNTAALASMPAGNYFVHVESAALATIPFYVIDIKVTPPTCGDSIVQVVAGEQCDHGASNGGAGDGCSATCQIKGGAYAAETEPNDTLATATNLDGKAGAVGRISPVGDLDFYSVHVTVPGSSITAAIDDGFGACPGGFDSTLTLYNPAGTKLATDLSGGASPCSRISPTVYPAAGSLPVGLYGLEVQRVSAALQVSYVLEVKVTAPGCGDGVLQAGEQCDPGPVSVPGCSATCKLTGDFIPETEPNGTLATANPLGTHAGFVGAINPAGDVDYFSFTVPGPSSLVVLQTGDGLGGCPTGFDSVLYLYDPAGTLLAQDDNGAGIGLCSEILPQLYSKAGNLPAGTYTARVEYKGQSAAQPLYVLTVKVLQPACGDGVLESGEQCDHGAANGTAGDGCSATCHSIAPWEIEPNGSTATATPAWSGFTTWKGSIFPVGDRDYYSFTLAAPGKVTLVTHDVDTPTVCTSDTVVTLLDQAGTQLASNDDGGPGPGDSGGGRCSKISAYTAPAGTYYAWVQRASDSRVIPAYQLDLTVQ